MNVNFMKDYDRVSFVNRIYESIDVIYSITYNDDDSEILKICYPKANIYYASIDSLIKSQLDTIDHIEQVAKDAREQDKISLLILDSIHSRIVAQMDREYKKEEDAYLTNYPDLLDKFYSAGYDYIFIRDYNLRVPTDANRSEQIAEEFVKLPRVFRMRGDAGTFNEFLKNYNGGCPFNPIDSRGQRQLLHFLVRSAETESYSDIVDTLDTKNSIAKYDLNWSKEGPFLSSVNKYPYHMTDSLHYVLPEIDYYAKKNYDVNLKALGITTHSFAIFKHNYIEK